MQQYLALVEASPSELEQLGRDILISVTAFVRDRSAFDVLESAISTLIQDAGREPVRIWVAGCATGEEAYSIAVMIAEAKRRHGKASRVVQIFATDIDEDALEVARREATLVLLWRRCPEWVERYFIATEHAFEVNKELRDMVVLPNTIWSMIRLFAFEPGFLP